MITIQTGDLFVNTYILHEENSKECVIIDPGGSFAKIDGIIEQYEYVPKYILLTHGHFDHIGAVAQIKEKYGVEVVIHKDGADMLTDSKKNLSAYLFKQEIVCGCADMEFDEEVIELCGMKIQTVHTPGHSPGSCVFLTGGVAFTGDTLFNMSIGRADFFGCDADQLAASLEKLKRVIPSDCKIFPGHGTDSDFGYELENNPYLKRNIKVK